MMIHIITHKRCNPIEAYLDEAMAKARYKELRKEQSEYGIISLEIKKEYDNTLNPNCHGKSA